MINPSQVMTAQLELWGVAKDGPNLSRHVDMVNLIIIYWDQGEDERSVDGIVYYGFDSLVADQIYDYHFDVFTDLLPNDMFTAYYYNSQLVSMFYVNYEDPVPTERKKYYYSEYGLMVRFGHAANELYKDLGKLVIHSALPWCVYEQSAPVCVMAVASTVTIAAYIGCVAMLGAMALLTAHIAQSRVCADKRAPLLLLCLVFFAYVPGADAVTCRTCFDQCPGCTGGTDCPFLSRTQQNALVLAGAATATATAVSMLSLLPIKFMRVLTRSVLDCLKTVALRPAAGTPVNLTPMTHEQLATAVESGVTQVGDALREVVKRIGAATTQIDITRLNALQGTLSSIERLGANIGSAGVAGSSGELLGAFTFAYAQAARVVRFGADTTAVAGTAGSQKEDDDSVRTNLMKARILRPASMAEFAHFLTVWQMICHAAGLCNVLTLGAFINDIVFETIRDQSKSWQIAHELLLVYLEVVETSADATINIANVFTRGSQDTLMARAQLQMERHFTSRPEGGRGIFRGRGGDDGDGDPSTGKSKWNGGFNTNDGCKPCAAYNLEKEHEERCLNSKGRCLFGHYCDHWVSDKGKNGRCEGKHPRNKCTNPNRVNKPASQ